MVPPASREAARKAVVAKLRRVIAKNGLNGPWTPPSDLIPIKHGTETEFVAALRLAVTAYHSHSRLVREAAWRAENRGAEADKLLRRPPEFRWMPRARIGVVKLFTYVMANGDGLDPRPAHTVDATRKKLDDCLAEGATGVIVDLRAHQGGNFRVALHALGGHLLRGRDLHVGGPRWARDADGVRRGEREDFEEGR
jgi:hypothetical protein